MIGPYMAQGLTLATCLEITGITRHQYYYRPRNDKKRGRPKSKTTFKIDQHVSNEHVISDIREIHSEPDTKYGYQRMTYALMFLGYFINHKKVYRLMKEANLLQKRRKDKSGKTYAKYRIVTPKRPLEVLEMDIKMVWLNQHRRHAYILTIIDTFTREVLEWCVGYQMKQEQVNRLVKKVIINHLQPANLLKEKLHIELRNDNGPQFTATDLRDFIKENHIDQVFTHPYTPQENGHVESFHRTLKDALGSQPYWSLEELETRLMEFYLNYNEVRIHTSIAMLPPTTFKKCWEMKLIERIELEKKKCRFKLKIPYQQLSGKVIQKEVPCLNHEPLDGAMDLSKEMAVGPN